MGNGMLLFVVGASALYIVAVYGKNVRPALTTLFNGVQAQIPTLGGTGVNPAVSSPAAAAAAGIAFAPSLAGVSIA